ncbi:MAG: alpha/beta hydrolase [Alphaproteobacteria bacterium]|nr:alpha/beta hydrolase [Alphaproteobacteria bacterium]
MLPEKFREPAGFRWGSFDGFSGAQIRYGSFRPKCEPKGTMVIVPGFREPIEKYFEVIREITAKGFAVWTMDWRGQGGSERFLKNNPQKMHSDGYGEHIKTLHHFANRIVKQTAKPLVLMAHSMGAHIGLRYLKEYPNVFNLAILTAPMFNISTGLLPKPVAKMIVQIAKAGNCLERYIPFGGDWNESKEVFSGNAKTSDSDRFRVTGEIYKNKPELKMGDPTYGWMFHTFASIDILNNEKYLKVIKTPVLMQISGMDTIIDNLATERANQLLHDCTCMHLPSARHEIWMERDEIRSLWRTKIDVFLEEKLNQG